MTPRNQAEPGPAKVGRRSGKPRAANSSITARRKAKASMVSTNEGVVRGAVCDVTRAKRIKMTTRTAHRPSMGKKPSWREVDKRILYRGLFERSEAHTSEF